MQTSAVKTAKVYLGVEVAFNTGGQMLPRTVIWEDGRRYEVDRVLDIRPAPALKAGGQGDRYTLRIRGQTTYIYFERTAAPAGNVIGRWFAERK